ncbi:hypothetical protein GLP21_12300 [Photobacterium carnosum]|uniref:Uncharacterized protein n=1 Tax=Photobacterium carnosum TaxID=2023717 RepID=A0A2N4UW45_9GAMM|nr:MULTISPECIES: hypothetical protein [Photobacterium]MCD9475847.1 hypothetical protein [Photobacterium phosphoreum]MCD9485898.1 hypothetical protein [Photobacterium iliopiscarium]MCD9507709.1 hypothetical protein [Photobacterium phosphoreum]MCD9538170.1 hypothetical protein [Photobacterium carnosum]MCD9542543.1 hypothetical protein [Photobacterium carnosum]
MKTEINIRLGIKEEFTEHLAEKYQRRHSTTYNGRKVRVTKAKLSADHKTVLFTLQPFEHCVIAA